MKKYFLVTAIICSIFLFSNCRKESSPVCEAGTGGGTTLVLFPRHHSAHISGAKAYLKFNTKSSPGSLSNFDLIIQGEANEDHIHAENLRCGDYFIYCVGFDSTISETVIGGIPYTIPVGSSGEIDVNIPVTE